MTARITGRRANADSDTALLAPAQASKTLMVLGLLKSGPKHGYELHRIVVAHGSLYPDFKKPTLYHLLHRLAVQGAVQVRPEGGARGPRGERLVFALARKGEALFVKLLRGALSSYDLSHTSFEVATAFLGWLPAAAAQELLRERRAVIQERRAELLAEMQVISGDGAGNDHGDAARMAPRKLAADHSLSLMDAEIAWTDRAIRQIGAAPSRKTAPAPGGRLKRAVGE